MNEPPLILVAKSWGFLSYVIYNEFLTFGYACPEK